MIDLNSKRFRDQVMGCWMGKNCGGTLGTPLEKAFGEEEPFNVKWYPKLEPGGMPNDDLEMQLVWLKALEEIGPGLRARDLAQYWIDYIGYNFDEYGLSKTNLRLGLEPPASGAYNNWFIDCMGCPIRSEIWACAAPGDPNTAVALAYQDAICDHAGGESVWGAFFNTAIESAAFVESDINSLLDIGRSYVPDKTATAKAVDTARKAYADGVDWLEARKRVLRATPHYVAQYSPINMGIQVIGLLYGKGFGHTLCLTVNCGYDTDCTGATVGAILGIIKGASKLPAKWTEPLGEKISTNASWGGLRNVETGDNPIPADLDSLTDRVIAVADTVLAAADDESGELRADAAVFRMAEELPMSITFPSSNLAMQIVYDTRPVIVPGKTAEVKILIRSSHPISKKGTVRITAPDAWRITPRIQKIDLKAGGTAELEWKIKAPLQGVHNSNQFTVITDLESCPSPRAVSFVLIGAKVFQVAGPYAIKANKGEGLNQVCGPEQGIAKWKTVYAEENALQPEWFSKPGIYYLKSFVLMDKGMKAGVKIAADIPSKLYVNGKLLTETAQPGPVRPNLGGAQVKFIKGWNTILCKVIVKKASPDVNLILDCGSGRLNDGFTEGEWTQLPPPEK